MNTHIVFGLFALYVAAMSLLLVLSGQQDTHLALLRRVWGRTLGHALYFVTRVALPVLLCVICLGWGVRQYDATIVSHDFDTSLELNIEYYRDLMLLLRNDKVHDPIELVYGA